MAPKGAIWPTFNNPDSSIIFLVWAKGGKTYFLQNLKFVFLNYFSGFHKLLFQITPFGEFKNTIAPKTHLRFFFASYLQL